MQKQSRDWTGNYNSTFKCLGATTHCLQEREIHDYYATDPSAIDKLFNCKSFKIPSYVWECACGEGHLAKRLSELGCGVYASDLINRGFGTCGVDFLKTKETPFSGVECCIMTNPPYKFADSFILHALELLKDGERAIFFLKTQYLEGVNRYKNIFKYYPPKNIYQFIGRMVCAKNGDFERIKKIESAVSYAWFEFVKGFSGAPSVYWI